MKASDLEPGMILKGNSGQLREILAMKGIRSQYKALSTGSAKGYGTPAPGKIRWVTTAGLASWAVCEVTEAGKRSAA